MHTILSNDSHSQWQYAPSQVADENIGDAPATTRFMQYKPARALLRAHVLVNDLSKGLGTVFLLLQVS